jgi:carbonic anhydrase
MTTVDNLIAGYQDFYKKYFNSGDMLYKTLARSGQSPKTLVIACSDSRVDPSIITHAKPGDLFVIRNVANLVPPFESIDSGHHGVSAAVEFAVRMLEVEHIVVLGHSKCAGIHALLEPDAVDETDFIGKWVNIARPARDKAFAQAGDGELNDDHHHICERESIMLSLENLLSFPWIKDKVIEKKVRLHGWYFSVIDGSLKEYNPASGDFEAIATEPEAL